MDRPRQDFRESEDSLERQREGWGRHKGKTKIRKAKKNKGKDWEIRNERQREKKYLMKTKQPKLTRGRKVMIANKGKK